MTTDNDKDRMRFYSIAIVFVLVISTALLLAATLAKKGQAQDAVLPVVAAAVLAVLAARFLGDAWEKLKNGIPLEDERSLRVTDKAGAWTFYTSIYMLLATGWYHAYLVDQGLPGLEVRHVTGGAIIAMAMLFGFWSWYHGRRDEVEWGHASGRSDAI